MASRQQQHGSASADLSGVMPFIRGGLSGMTGGLERYIAAPMMLAIDKLMKGGMTYEEALETLRRQEQEDADTAPVSRATGQVLGSLVPGSQLAKGGKVATVLGNTALGAAQGFAANPEGQGTTLQDTAIGAGLGAALGGIGAGTSAVLENLAKTQASHGIKNALMKDEAWKKGARAAIKAAGGGSGKTGGVVDADIKKMAAQEAANLAKQGVVPKVEDAAKGSIRERLTTGVLGQLRGVPAQAITGGALGGGLALLTGGDPITMAASTAGATIAGAKANAMLRAQGTLRAAAGQKLMSMPKVQAAPMALTPVPTPAIGMVMGNKPAQVAQPEEPEQAPQLKMTHEEVDAFPWETNAPASPKAQPKVTHETVDKLPWE